jgi:hypothetical protein
VLLRLLWLLRLLRLLRLLNLLWLLSCCARTIGQLGPVWVTSGAHRESLEGY